MKYSNQGTYDAQVVYDPWLLPIERLALELAKLDPHGQLDEHVCRSSGLGSTRMLDCARAQLDRDGLLERAEEAGWSVTSAGKECLALGRRRAEEACFTLHAVPPTLACGDERELSSPEELARLPELLRDNDHGVLRGTPTRVRLRRNQD